MIMIYTQIPMVTILNRPISIFSVIFNYG
jgi:hypothetical protein